MKELMALFLFVGILLKFSSAQTHSMPAPEPVNPTASSMTVEFPSFSSNSGGDVLAYDLAIRSLDESHWRSISDNLGSQGYNISYSQIVNVRVDRGKTIAAGSTFQLALQRLCQLAGDFESLARTPPIPFDATSAVFKTALDQLGNVIIREVKRCDEFGRY